MRKVIGVLFTLITCQALAAAPVVDIEDGNSAQAQTGQQRAAQQAGAEIYYQLQMLQEEVRELRGLVEQQSYEIRQLKQRQLDDYRDLDRRISALMANGDEQAALETPVRQTAAAVDERAPAGNGGDTGVEAERQSYDAAYQLLKDRKIDESVTAFQEHLKQYPDGRYAANAHYWLGEIHLLQGNLDKSRQSFAAVVEQFPAHRKASDAMFKLGKVYHLQGNNAKAREMLNRAARTDSTAATLAEAYLRENLPPQ